MKIIIPLCTIASSERLPTGLREDAKEYALHQINFDRNNRFSELKKIMLSSQLFTANEIKQDAFIEGLELAEREAKKANPRLRGTILWNL